MKKNKLFILTLLFWLTGQAIGLANLILDGEKTTLEFWLRNTPDTEKVILTLSEIELLNKKIRETSLEFTPIDLANYPKIISSEILRKQLEKTRFHFEGDLYYNDKPLTESFKSELICLENRDRIPDKVTTRYAVTVRHADIKNLPFSGAINDYSPNITQEFDRLQETTVSTGEAVAVLHDSRDGNFCYVQCSDYCGWIAVDALAFTDREKWLKYVKPQNFLTVIKKCYKAKLNGEELFYHQGTALPLLKEKTDHYIISAPRRNKDGHLHEMTLKISKQETALCKGYLPYTSGNILRSAFADYGVPYGWGGMNKGLDCSDFIQNVYRTVGIHLPRNGNDQENTFGRTTKIKGLTAKESLTLMQNIRTGAAICLKGHILLYLGNIEGIAYVIHAPWKVQENGRPVLLGRVAVTTLDTFDSAGASYWDRLETAKEFVLDK